MKCSAIVVAGGSGNRFGGLKQFALLHGESVAARSVTLCRTIADTVVLVVPAGMTDETHGADRVVEGGGNRSMSVRAGLAALDDDVEVVVIHDAARPLASERLFSSVVAELSDESLDGAIVGLPVVDTIKQVTRVGERIRVHETIDREQYVTVQTPQAFRAAVLRQAHQQHETATDDAALVEALGGIIVVVPGEDENIKITSPADVVIAEKLLGGRV